MEGGKGEGKGREGSGVEEKEREGPKLLLNQGPLRALVRHWLLSFATHFRPGSLSTFICVIA